ncbi:MAG: molybdate ABC transporter substrate-binding protein [Xanthobacteraceae bacterium]
MRTVMSVMLALTALNGTTMAAELKILTTPALTETWEELRPKFEAAGHKLTIVYAPSGAIAKRVSEGEAADLLVSTPAGIDSLIKAGKVLDGTNTPIANSPMGVAVLKGAPKPDVSTPDAFKRALLAAKAVAYTDPASGGASGAHMAKVLDRLGIASEVNAKAKLGRGTPVANFLVSGEADIAIQQMPELLHVKGAEVIGPLPGDLQNVTTFAAGIPSGSAQAETAKALIRFLQTPESGVVMKKYGLDQVPAAAPPKAS